MNPSRIPNKRIQITTAIWGYTAYAPKGPRISVRRPRSHRADQRIKQYRIIRRIKKLPTQAFIQPNSFWDKTQNLPFQTADTAFGTRNFLLYKGFTSLPASFHLNPVTMISQTHGFFVLRRPLLPASDYFQFQDQITGDPSAFEPELLKRFQDPVLQQAIRLASESLYQKLMALLSGQPDSGKQAVLESLYKYYIRMCTRCTPFGHFAGVATGAFNGRTLLRFDSRNPYREAVRYDIGRLDQLRKELLARRSVLKKLTYFVNSSLYETAGGYRYLERTENGPGSGFMLSQIEPSALLGRILLKARSGISFRDLLNIVHIGATTRKEAEKYLFELIESQVLLSELEINVTGPHYQNQLTQTLYQLLPDRHAVRALKELKKPVLDAPYENRVQKDLHFNTLHCQLPESLPAKLLEELSRLGMLLTDTKHPELESFARRFHERYGERQMPLLQSLDYDYGIGFGKLSLQAAEPLALLQDVRIDAQVATGQPHAAQELSHALYFQSLTERLEKIEITDQILARHKGPVKRFPERCYVLGSLLSASKISIDRGDFLFDLKALSGPSGAALLSRFSSQDPDLHEKIEALIRTEESQNPDIIYAEIAHVPGVKAANILSRPAFRCYEIPYLANSTRPQAERIEPSDLLVSCPNGKQIILWSARLARRVVPVLTSAHYFANDLPVYRFLCELSSQYSPAQLFWDWGKLGSEAFLPRVTYKHLLLSKARWRIGLRDLGLTAGKKPSSKAWWKRALERCHIPRYVQIGGHDQQLVIDTESTAGLSILWEKLSKNQFVELTEFLQRDQDQFLMADQKPFCNEIVIPCFAQHKSETEPKPFQLPLSASAALDTDFNLGSRWLYVKLYSSERLTDALLTQSLEPLCQRLEKDLVIEKWFFVRYHDPEPHLRIRFYHSHLESFWNLVLSELHKVLAPHLESGSVYRLQTDTYMRETGRYTILPYKDCESIFHIDSCAVSRSLSLLSDQHHTQLYWLLALRGADQLLSDLGLCLEGKLQLTERLAGQFLCEQPRPDLLKIQLDKRYRSVRSLIEWFISEPSHKELVVQRVLAHFRQRSKNLRRILKADQLLAIKNAPDFAGHLIHMYLNRWFFTCQRQQELFIYHYLKKYYKTRMKITSRSEKSNPSACM